MTIVHNEIQQQQEIAKTLKERAAEQSQYSLDIPKISNIIASSFRQETKQKSCKICGKPYIKAPINEINIQCPDCNCEINEYNSQNCARFLAEEKAKLEEVFSISEMSPKFLDASFGNWSPREDLFNTEKESLKLAYNACFELCNSIYQFQKNGKSILLLSNPGAGKTHLAAASFNFLKNFKCVFVDLSRFLDKINYLEKDHKFSKNRILNLLKITDLVVINDFGKEKYTDTRLSTVFDIFDTLYGYEKSIIITMNHDSYSKLLPIPEMEAILDRIIGMCKGNIIKMDVPSYRRIKEDK